MCSLLVLESSHNYLTKGNKQIPYPKCLSHNMAINRTHVHLPSLQRVYVTWCWYGHCHSLCPSRCNSTWCHDWRCSMWSSMWSAMRSVRCPWSLWSHCTWCHLTGWSLIPQAMSLASRKSRCLLNQISSTSAICPWSLCPTAAMARCLLMKKNTTTHSLKTKNSISVTSNCYIHKDML